MREGSAGFAVSGHQVVVVLDNDLRELAPGEPGTLALGRARSPLFWFAGYHEQPTPAFRGDYYLSGDTVERNADGSITSSGYRIGPFDVESAVVGKPDQARTEIVKAFVVLAAEVAPSEALIRELQQHVRERLSAHA